MRFRRAAALAVAGCAAFLPAHGAGATAAKATPLPVLGGWTTITGTTGYVDVRLAHKAPITFDFADHAKPSYMQVTGDPAAMVVVMSMSVVRGNADGVWIPIIKLPADAGGRTVYMHDRNIGMPAGEYRLFLVAPHRSAVRFFLPGQGDRSVRLTPRHSTAAVARLVEDPHAAADATAHHHSNYLGDTVRDRAMAVGLTWSFSPQPPALRFVYGCTYDAAPIGGTPLPGGVPLPGCPGAFLTFGEDTFPLTTNDYVTGYAVGPEPAGEFGTSIDLTLVGPTTAVGSVMYDFEY